MTAFMILRGYIILRQASNHLQMKGLDYLSFLKIVEETKSKSPEVRFGEINVKVQNFISSMKEALDDTDVDLQTEL